MNKNLNDLISRKRILYELSESTMPKQYRDFCIRVINDTNLTPPVLPTQEYVHDNKYVYIIDDNPSLKITNDKLNVKYVTKNISVDKVFENYKRAVDYIEKQGFEHVVESLYKNNCGYYKEIKTYEVQK